MSEKPWLGIPNINGKNENHNFGNISLSDNEIQQNFNNIKTILEGKTSIDYVGTNNVYSYLFNFVANNKKVVVNYLDPRLEPSELAEHMVSDSLVVSELPEDIVGNISKNLNGKKQIIIGNLYKENELVNNSGMHR